MQTIATLDNSAEAALADARAPRDETPVVELALTGLVKSRWELGGAVRSDSRDLGYAVGDALTALVEGGGLKEICARYGVTYSAPTGF